MSQQNSTPHSPVILSQSPEQGRAASAPEESATQAQQQQGSLRSQPSEALADNPKRVQYGQGFSKDHPAQPGTDPNLKHSAAPNDRDKSAD